VRKTINPKSESYFIVLKCIAFKDYFFYVYFVVSLVIPFRSEAQLLDSLRVVLKNKPTIDFRADSRNNFISSRKASTFGFKIGLDYDSRLRFGVGYNFLRSRFYERFTFGSPLNTQVQSRRLVLRYLCVYIDYVYYNSRRWTFSVPVQLGFGRTFYREIYPVSATPEREFSPIVLYEPCLSGEYRILPWLALSANAGFRIVLLRGNNLKQKLTAPVYVGGISIYWTRLYRKIFPGRGEWYELFKVSD
jgi:hypothetical protein